MNIPAIETKFDGRFFRSRTEARWAAFFKALGWPYEYEKEGYDLSGVWYLPDFYLPDMKLWIEVKGAEPTPGEVALCRQLAAARQEHVLLAVGQPQPEAAQLLAFWHDEENGSSMQTLLADRRNDGEYWLLERDRDGNPVGGRSIGPVYGPSHDRYPLMLPPLRAAYAAALSERFA